MIWWWFIMCASIKCDGLVNFRHHHILIQIYTLELKTFEFLGPCILLFRNFKLIVNLKHLINEVFKTSLFIWPCVGTKFSKFLEECFYILYIFIYLFWSKWASAGELWDASVCVNSSDAFSWDAEPAIMTPPMGKSGGEIEREIFLQILV